MYNDHLWALPYAATPPCMDDTELLAGLKRGDSDAVEYVVQQYAPALYRFAYHQMHEAVAAEDLVAEVLARMLKHVDSFVVEQASFQAWLFRIARNLIIDYHRGRTRRPQVSLEARLELEPASEPGGYDPHIERLLDREELREALATVTGEQREVILLHVIEGWDLPDVALLLDRTLPSVKGLYYRGVQALRRALVSGEPVD